MVSNIEKKYQIESTGEIRNVYKILDGKVGEKTIWDIVVGEEHDIKVEGVGWFELAHDRIQQRVIVKTDVNIPVS